MFRIIQFRCPSSSSWKEGETKLIKVEQALPFAVFNGCYDRDIGISQLKTEIMLLLDLRITPSVRAVELSNQGFSLIDANLIDAVLFALLMVVFMYISFKPVNTRGVGRCHKAMCTHENLTKVCTKLLNHVHKFCAHMHKFWSLFSSFHYVSKGASPACWQTAHATQERALPNSALY